MLSAKFTLTPFNSRKKTDGKKEEKFHLVEQNNKSMRSITVHAHIRSWGEIFHSLPVGNCLLNIA
jgi:hypothetical protein